VVVPCSHVIGISTDGAGTVQQVTPTLQTSAGPPSAAHILVGSQGFYPIVVYTGATDNYGFEIPLDAFLIHGATLSTATLYLRPISGHGGLPTRQPKFGIVRKSVAGYNTAAESLLTTSYAQLAAGSVVAYEADSTIVYTPDQNNVIDRTLYSYTLVLYDEGGTNALAGNRYAQVRLAFGAIPDARRS
jgi:hypothetical protein